MKTLEEIEILGAKVTTSSEAQILEYIEELLAQKSGKAFIVTPNPEIILYAYKNSAFRKILNSAQIALPDGVGVSAAARILYGMRLPRITGVDFMEKLSRKLSKSTYNIGFFGGQPGVAEMAADCLAKKYSGLKISYASDTWSEDQMKLKNIDVLFVAMGFPKQEKWIYENIDKIPARVLMGVGGSFDFVSGRVRRAPLFLRKVGLEWLFRLFLQPWRWKRQLALIWFVLLVLKDKFQPQNTKTGR